MVRSFVPRARCLALGALLLSLLLLGLQPGSAAAIDRVVMGIPASPPTFHPWSLGVHLYMNQPQFYDRLLYHDNELNVVKQLATDYSFSKDGKVFTVKLRKDARFHNGKPLDSHAVKKAWEFVANGQYRGPAINSRPLARAVKELRTPDDYTVEFVYDQPNAAVIDFMDLFYIADIDQIADIDRKPAGSGPYKLKEFDPGSRVVLEPNTDYWGKVPEVELEWRITPDEQAQMIGLESKSLQAIYLFNPREAPRLEQAGYKVYQVNRNGILVAVGYNNEHGALKDARVRRALDKLIPRTRFHRTIMNGVGEARCLPFPSYSLGYSEDLANYCKVDVEGAKELLSEAGLGNGFDVELLVSTQENFLFPRLGALLQDTYRAAGVRAKIVDKDAGGFRGSTAGGDYQVATLTFGRANKDPASLFGTAVWWHSNPKSNRTNFTNPKWQEFATRGQQEIDPSKRRAIYRDMMEFYIEQMPISSVHTNPRFVATLPEVSTVGSGPDGFVYFWNTKLLK